MRRFNKHGVDLNRNFPDAFERDEEEQREAEVQAVMDWLNSEPFVLSANLHGGAVVASYPYDNSNRGTERLPQQGGSRRAQILKDSLNTESLITDTPLYMR